MKRRSNKQITPLMIIVLIVIALLTIFYYNILLSLENREDSVMLFRVLVGPYRNVLDPDTLIISTAKIRQAIINEDILCDHGSISMLKQGSVTYIYMCMLDKIEVNPEVEIRGKQGYKSVRNITPIGVVSTETGNYTVPFFSGDYVKIYSKFFSFEIDIPEDAEQGLIRAFEDGDEVYYLILNIPYIYFKAKYIEGIGNASLIIRVVFNINGVNLTDPFIMEYYLDSNTEAFLSLLESPKSRSFIEEKSKALAPLLDIDGGKRVELKYYIDVFVKSSGKYQLELTIGYPGVRVVELQ